MMAFLLLETLPDKPEKSLEWMGSSGTATTDSEQTARGTDSSKAYDFDGSDFSGARDFDGQKASVT